MTSSFTDTLTGFDAVVIANGDFPTLPRLLQLMKESEMLVCLDGAAQRLHAMGIKPTVVIGDGDSISKDVAEELKDVLILISEQEFNDLTKAMKHLAAMGKKRILILGATGKREDHTLGNISLLADYYEMGIDATIASDYGIFTVAGCGSTTFQSFSRQQVSIFNLNATALSSEGLQYPIRPFTRLWQGTLNQSEGSQFSIKAEGDTNAALYIVYRTLLPKA